MANSIVPGPGGTWWSLSVDSSGELVWTQVANPNTVISTGTQPYTTVGSNISVIGTFNGWNIISMPVQPAWKQLDFSASDSVGINQSPFTMQTQTQYWAGADMWHVNCALPPMSYSNAKAWIAFLLLCQGRLNVFSIGDTMGATPQGTPTGTPVVAGTNLAASNTLVTSGWANSKSGLLYPGDYIQLGYRLHVITTTVNSSSTGTATLRSGQACAKLQQQDNHLLQVIAKACSGWLVTSESLRFEKRASLASVSTARRLADFRFAEKIMPRALTADTIAQLKSTVIRPIFLVSLAFPTPVYVWSGIGTLVWNGISWLGMGDLGKISPICETTFVDAQGIVLSLSGIDTTLLTDSMSDMTAGAAATIYLGFITAAGAVIDNPIIAYSGFMDQSRVKIGTTTSIVEIDIENRLAQLNRSRGGRYTDADQRARYARYATAAQKAVVPSDGCCRWVAFLQDRNLCWT